MASFATEFKHLEIQLEDIISATNNFDESKVIGRGGFGKVYAGELSHSQSEEKSLVAIKRLDRIYGQGDPEFFKEIRMLSCYRHENLISLLGFCCQGGEMILIYEYASGGSLDRLLSSAALTWTQRLRICLDAAKGLSFLHDPNGTQQRVLHCDIKSSNVLLDDNMTAKVSDFGLSKMGPANQQYSLLITGALGTPGYCDPVFMETYSLTKESDVYSFGVVLLEILSGKLCVENIGCELKVYVPSWKKSYEENKLNEIIFQDLMQQMDPSSLKTFSDIAFQCLQKAREERPTMSHVVEELEIALESQEFPDLRLEMLTKHENILMAVDPLLIYKTGNYLKELLSKGLTINKGKKWLSINEKGEHVERIYIEACLNPYDLESAISYNDIVNSRFPGGRCYEYEYKLKARVSGEYLTPQISYTVNLVFRYKNQSDVNRYCPLRYKIKGEDETKVFIIYPTYMRQDGWFVIPLYHFTSQHTTSDLQVEFEHRRVKLLIAGIEFQPCEEKVELPVFEDYQYIIDAASQPLTYRSLEEVKQILRIGIYLKDYKTWFSLNTKGEHCVMISIKDCLIPNEDFPPRFKARVRGQYLTPQISYTVNLVFRYEDQSHVKKYNPLRYKIEGEDETKVFIIYPTIHEREDGWFVAPLYRFTSQHTTADLQFEFESCNNYQFQFHYSTTNLLVAGIEFRPSEEKVELPVFDYYRSLQELIEAASQSLAYRSLQELKQILSVGIHLKDYKTWFSLNKKGEHCHLISMKDCLIPNEDFTPRYESNCFSRFPAGLYQTNGKGFKTHVKTELLSPLITYTVNLVFQGYLIPKEEYIDFKCRLKGETTTSTVKLAERRNTDLFYITELCQFNSDGSIVDIEIDFEDQRINLNVEGILFEPLEKVEDQVSMEDQLSKKDKVEKKWNFKFWKSTKT